MLVEHNSLLRYLEVLTVELVVKPDEVIAVKQKVFDMLVQCQSVRSNSVLTDSG